MNERMEQRGRDLGLDALRAVAVLLVLGRHLWLPIEGGPAWLSQLLTVWQRGGWVGVDLFFVLSGFLVAGLLFREHRQRGSLSVGRFLLRRGFKIYPAFWALLLVTVLVGRSTRLPPIARPAVAAELLFVQNYVRGVWNHTWSLAVEEHFYVALPLLLGCLAWRRRADPFRPLVAITLLTSAGLLVLRCVAAACTPFDAYTHLFPTHLRIDSLMLGVLLAYGHHYHRARLLSLVAPLRWLLVLLGGACLIPAFLFELETTPFLYTGGLTLFALGSCLLVAAVTVAPRHGAATRLLARLGAHSYSIYLWHMPVLLWGLPLLEWLVGTAIGYPARMTIYVVGSLVGGVGMARLIEVPALALRDRWFPSARSPSRLSGAVELVQARIRLAAGRSTEQDAEAKEGDRGEQDQAVQAGAEDRE